MALQGGRNIMTGRHAAGTNPAPGSGTNPASKKKVISEPKGNMPTTASYSKMHPMTEPGAFNASSKQAEGQVRMPPEPFKNPNGPANLAAPKAPKGALPGPDQKPTSNLANSKAPAKPNPQPTGYNPMSGIALGNVARGGMNTGTKKGKKSVFFGE